MPWNNDHNHHGTQHKEKTNWKIIMDEYWRQFRQEYLNFSDKHLQNFDGRKCMLYLLATGVLFWLISGIYIVDQSSRGVLTRFGAYRETTLPGPHWHWPYPIEEVQIVNVEKQRYIELGYRSGNRHMNSANVLGESLMLTRDENIVNLRLAVQYQIKNASDFLFNVKDNEHTLKELTESIQRGVIGRNSMDFILTEGRSQIVSEIKENTQQALDQYQTGLRITSVNLQDAQPPEEVQHAFEDAIRAREDKQRMINEAQAYANEIIPKARGSAARVIQDAEAYEAQIVAQAKGESERFDQLLTEYEKAPKVTRKRLYLEAKEKLYQQTNKVIMNVENGNSMFYMPMNQLNQVSHEEVVDTEDRSFNRPIKKKRPVKKHTSVRPSRSK